MTNSPAKGSEMLLDLGQSASKRINCGLRWDPPADNMADTDLDLLCLMYDEHNDFVDAVSGTEGETIDKSGYVYHTGDDTSGEGDHDDERVTLELFNLPKRIHHILFVVEIQSDHQFGSVLNPEIRIADAMTDKNMIRTAMGEDDGAENTAFILGRLYRHPDGWMFHHIGDYMNRDDIADWMEWLTCYLPEPTAPPKEKTKCLDLSKGEQAPLLVTKTARHRMLCGLNWNPINDGAENADLDLMCALYTGGNEFIDAISGTPNESRDETGHVYHSGDNTSGEGSSYDDEQISVELRDMPDEIRQIIFFAEIQSAHTFENINAPALRIADAASNDDLFQVNLDQAEGADKTAYVFARVFCHDNNWIVQYIGEYINGAEIEDWIDTLEQFLPVEPESKSQS